ncbi:hypothetical protein MVEN_02315200 [Mycena venus]|uniref:Uncharacterized protein n=1 Tax=Mycena venus TaxID=2733690 RepID=A0A8H6X4I6_9AGAR|nr:hypothetical protein MVEN_02315200 [Mycena venus]
MRIVRFSIIAVPWGELANSLRLASANSGGSNSCITRSGEACRVRFNLLRKKYKADEARSLQQTGTDEEVDEFIKLLGELCALVDAKNLPGTKAAKQKTALEGRAGRELRDASMMGLVRGDGLLDVTSLEGATVRERQGQHAKQDHERHVQQLAALNKLADAMQGVNDNICSLREEQEKTNQMLRQQELDRREEQIRRREAELGI